MRTNIFTSEDGTRTIEARISLTYGEKKQYQKDVSGRTSIKDEVVYIDDNKPLNQDADIKLLNRVIVTPGFTIDKILADDENGDLFDDILDTVKKENRIIKDKKDPNEQNS